MVDFRVSVDERAIDELAAAQFVHDALEDQANSIVNSAQQRAPKRSGAGARSIHQEMQKTSEGWEVEISWDPDHFYMGFQEMGTIYIRPHGFLRGALEARGYTRLR